MIASRAFLLFFRSFFDGWFDCLAAMRRHALGLIQLDSICTRGVFWPLICDLFLFFRCLASTDFY
ncbi:MAG: hypothetical protein CBARDMAM_6009 [uncultured Caballeronia sp.]|nr:MAG: hypothetical protein CBARDMAM_6009 [uncultured Caballeronia sp.]